MVSPVLSSILIAAGLKKEVELASAPERRRERGPWMGSTSSDYADSVEDEPPTVCGTYEVGSAIFRKTKEQCGLGPDAKFCKWVGSLEMGDLNMHCSELDSETTQCDNVIRETEMEILPTTSPTPAPTREGQPSPSGPSGPSDGGLVAPDAFFPPTRSFCLEKDCYGRSETSCKQGVQRCAWGRYGRAAINGFQEIGCHPVESAEDCDALQDLAQCLSFSNKCSWDAEKEDCVDKPCGERDQAHCKSVDCYWSGDETAANVDFEGADSCRTRPMTQFWDSEGWQSL